MNVEYHDADPLLLGHFGDGIKLWYDDSSFRSQLALRMERLSAAERDVVRRAIAGASNDSIARERRCAVRTVANLLARAYAKLGVRSRRELVAKLAATGPDAARRRLAGVLTPREQDVLRLLARGLGNKQIAYELGLALPTIGAMITRAKRKLGVTSSLELIAYWQSGSAPST